MFLLLPGNHYHEFLTVDAPPPPKFAARPSPTDHPLLVARKLIQLACCAQQLDVGLDTAGLLPEPPRRMWTRFLQLASLVTRDDRLLDSLEGIDTLLLEATAVLMTGNLRLALVLLRRVITLAHIMGLHRPGARPPAALEPELTRASPSGLWARTVYLERYACLILGVPSVVPLPPQSTSTAARPHLVLPIEIIDAAHAAIAGRIIERREAADWADYARTAAIDAELQRAAASVPADWWLAPELRLDIDPLRLMLGIVETQTQIIHYNLMTILHLPFMLRSARGRDNVGSYEYSPPRVRLR